jgi:glycosyltransferase involved in cell wall biosynthesis
VAPKLGERLGLTCDKFDVVDVHSRHASLAVAVARTRLPRLVFTPAAMDAFLGWPYAGTTRAVVASSSQIVCHSEIDRDLLCATFPDAASRAQVLPDGVDAAALSAARPFVTAGIVVLAVDRLDRSTGVGHAIAAMLGLDPEFRLVVAGDGPERDRLVAFAADLRISPRVEFVGAVSESVLYRWLRTARVVVTLAGDRGSGSLLVEASAAGASVVASDLPIHRQAAARSGGGPVIFVAPKGSPLDVADAIEEAARISVLSTARSVSFAAPSWESVIESTWALYDTVIADATRSLPSRGVSDVIGMPARLRTDAAPAGAAAALRRLNGRVRWR